MHNDKFATVCAIKRNKVGGDGHMLENLPENKHVSLCAWGCLKIYSGWLFMLSSCK